MRFPSTFALALQAASLATALPASDAQPGLSARGDDGDITDGLADLNQLATSAYQQVKDDLENGDLSKRGGTCTLKNLRVRREWGSLPKSEKKAYIAAVKCLQAKDAKTPTDLVPGAKSRFDDFVATHINQTLTIHYTGNFLSWHRYFTWSYEQALRDECGYTGSQPYWDWAKSAISGLANSPVFDGSETSMSGDGEYIPGRGQIVLGGSTGLSPIYLPAGTGGGCVTSGPFKDMEVNLGPVALDIPGNMSIANPDGQFAYNPRCLKRDLTDYANQNYANASAILADVLEPQDVNEFQMALQGVPGSGNLAVHGGGHYSLGGDPGRDLYVSPGDPAFYMHHAMIDRVWWLWQMMSPAERQSGPKALMGTNTFLDNPPSANTTVDDLIDLYYAAGPAQRIGDLLSTYAGPFCYVYL